MSSIQNLNQTLKRAFLSKTPGTKYTVDTAEASKDWVQGNIPSQWHETQSKLKPMLDSITAEIHQKSKSGPRQKPFFTVLAGQLKYSRNWQGYQRTGALKAPSTKLQLKRKTQKTDIALMSSIQNLNQNFEKGISLKNARYKVHCRHCRS